MAYQAVLALLEVVALSSCIWGLQLTYGNSPDNLSLVYNSTWFVFGALTNLTGIITSGIRMTSSEARVLNRTSKQWRRIHYLLCWLTVVLGYPTLTASFYKGYYETQWIHALLAPPVIPLIFWQIKRDVSFATQLSIGALIPVQFWIAYTTSNKHAMYGAGMMALNLLSLSVRTGFKILGISPKESYISGVAACSIFWAWTIDTMAHDPKCSCYKSD